jgi:hypothetical protein
VLTADVLTAGLAAAAFAGAVPPGAAVALPRLAAVALLARARRRAPGYTERQQLGWLLVGLVAASTADGLLAFGPEAEARRDLAALVSLAIPVTTAFALLKYRLLDLEVLVGRRLADAALAFPLAAAALAVDAALGPLPPARRLLQALLLGAVALGAWLCLRHPFRRRAARVLRLDGASGPLRARLLAALEAEPDAAAGLSALAAALVADLGLTDARCLAHAGEGRLWPFAPGGALPPVTVRPGGRLLALAQSFGAPVPAADLRDGPLEADERALLDGPEGGTTLLVPCLAGERLVALLQIGPGRDGVRPERAAYRALSHAAADLGPALEVRWRLALAERRLALGEARAAAERAQLAGLYARDTARHVRPALAALRDRVRDAADAEGLSALERLAAAILARDPATPSGAFDAAPVVDEACLLMEPALAAHGVVLVRRVARPAFVAGDPDRLRLLVTELLRQSLDSLRRVAGPRQIDLALEPDAAGAASLIVADSGAERPLRDEPLLGAPAAAVSFALVDRLARLDGGRLERRALRPAGQEVRVRLGRARAAQSAASASASRVSTSSSSAASMHA